MKDKKKEDDKLIHGLPLPLFIAAVKKAAWINDAEAHGLELAYMDEEVIVFRVEKVSQRNST